MSSKKSRGPIRLWAVLVWLIVWQLGAMVIDQKIILVSPFSVLARLLELLPTLDFWQTIAIRFCASRWAFSVAWWRGRCLLRFRPVFNE